MRIDCHLHTNQYSCCSHIAPQRACELALARGLDALLFTEHAVYWRQAGLDKLQTQFPALKLYSGIEIALNEGYHVVAFGARFLDEQIPLLPLSELNALVAQQRRDIFLFVAHAFRYHAYPTPELPRILQSCDGMEMNSINILRGHALKNLSGFSPVTHALYQKHLQAYNLTPLYNTDGHDEDIIGLIANEIPVPTPPRNEIELAHLFKNERPSEFQNSAQLSRHHLLNSPEYS